MELPLEIARIPKQDVIEKLSPSSSNESFDERMGQRDVGHSLQFLDFEDSQIRLPSMKLKKWIVVAADTVR